MSANLYAERDPMALEPYFSQHIAAMTAEGLHSKAAIAEELAHRDARIAALEAYAKRLEEASEAMDKTLKWAQVISRGQKMMEKAKETKP